MPTLPEQLRAYVLLHGWQARDVQMNGCCIFIPTVGRIREAFAFPWGPEMDYASVLSGCESIAEHENRLRASGPRRTAAGVLADLKTAWELMNSAPPSPADTKRNEQP